MSNARIGRNDPCPCGSGKKYKKCCGLVEEYMNPTSDPFMRYSNLITAIKIKLDSIYEKEIRTARRDLMNRFLYFTVGKSLSPEHDSLFSDWLWFDQTGENGDTLGFHYLKEHAAFMEEPLRECLLALNLSYLSVYQVTKYDGTQLHMRDVFTDRSFPVLLKEPWELEGNEESILLLGRLIQCQDANLFSGMVLLLEDEPGYLDFIVEHVRYAARLQGEEVTNLLKFDGEILFGVFDHALKKTLVNLNDIRYCPLIPGEAERLHNSLLADRDYNLEHTTDGFSWFKPTYEHFGYVRVALSEDTLLCSADVLEDISKLDKWLAEHPVQAEPVVIANLMLPGPHDPAHLPLWFRALKDQQTEKWLDTPHPELENQSPRECLVRSEGKERVLQLLDTFASSLQHQESQELIEYMTMRVRENS